MTIVEELEQLEASTEENGQKKIIKTIAVWILIIGVLALLGYGIKGLFSGSAPQKKQITTVKLLPDTPPPPPPPPPKEPPKEQPKEQPKEIKVEQPKPVEAPAENLKMEGPAGDGPSPFQAGQVSKEYEKGDPTKIGGKKGLAAFMWFTNKIDAHIKRTLANDPELSKAKFQVDVRVYLTQAGDIERAELLESSGDKEIDSKIRKVLASVTGISEKAPEDMPRKAVIRVTSQTIG